MIIKQKKDIRDFSYDELVSFMRSIGETPFRAAQIFDWIYHKDIRSFDDMKNLSRELRNQLSGQFTYKPFPIDEKQVSEDGTTKFLFELDDREKIETVLIPTARRTTVCVSTQAGCKFGCRFCASGIGGLKRNLSSAEILTQIAHVKSEAKQHKKPLSHVVFMGIGEPLDNFDNLMKSIKVINDKNGYFIGARRITISTCGVIPNIYALSQQGLQLELAISLHGYDNESRNILMPVNRKYPFNDLIESCRAYQKTTKRQLTFEYILIKDITCTKQAVQSLKKAFKGLICKMNLIPYNPVSEFEHQTPARKEIFDFKKALGEFGVHSTIRSPRGRDVAAACGQLRHAA